MRTIYWVLTLAVYLGGAANNVFAGSYFSIDAYQLEYQSSSENRINLVPVESVADIGDYYFGYVVFSKWMKPNQIYKGEITYVQNNLLYYEGMTVQINPFPRKNQLDVVWDLSKCKSEFTEKIKSIKVSPSEIFDGAAYAVLYTYKIRKEGLFRELILKIEGIDGYEKVRIYNLDNVDSKWTNVIKGVRDDDSDALSK